MVVTEVVSGGGWDETSSELNFALFGINSLLEEYKDYSSLVLHTVKVRNMLCKMGYSTLN